MKHLHLQNLDPPNNILALVPCFFHITAEEFHHVAPICVCVCQDLFLLQLLVSKTSDYWCLYFPNITMCHVHYLIWTYTFMFHVYTKLMCFMYHRCYLWFNDYCGWFGACLVMSTLIETLMEAKPVFGREQWRQQFPEGTYVDPNPRRNIYYETRFKTKKTRWRNIY